MTRQNSERPGASRSARLRGLPAEDGYHRRSSRRRRRRHHYSQRDSLPRENTMRQVRGVKEGDREGRGVADVGIRNKRTSILYDRVAELVNKLLLG